ncbi:MAG TPA: hypothetical protein VFQ53_11190 [Kofleriaceae bacterium]|nr:hypothetical protein [Kofleriaceae bacterium]
MSRALAIASLFVVACGGFVVACAGPAARTGKRVEAPAPTAAITRASTAEPDGVRVLANTRAAAGKSGLVASTPAELRALWRDVGLRGAPPPVDFARHVVIGTNFESGVCQPEIVGARVDAAHVLTLETVEDGGVCILLAVRIARVVAVPRALVGTHFTWRTSEREAYAFEVAPPSATAPPPAVPPASAAIVERGRVALPAPGTIALRALANGRAIWVVNREADDVSVLLADLATAERHVRTRVSWDAKRGRFSTDHDSRGHSVHGGAPLTRLAFERRGDQLIVGDPLVESPRPFAIEARAAAPRLEGAATPYDAIAPVELSAVRDGEFGVVAADLITGLDGIPRLCTLPEGKLRRYLTGCPANAPALADTAHGTRAGIDQREGPFVVRRRGRDVDLVIAIGGGAAGWVVDGPRATAAPKGATRARGALVVGRAVTGDTHGAADGFAPSCIVADAQGAPDENWSFTATDAGTYAFGLTSDRDGVLAIVRASGEVICADDPSALTVELARGEAVRVVVDAFAGFAQRYTLRAERLALPDGGVLQLGRPVSGDTTHAIDQHSEGCSAPAGDHAYRFTVDHQASYRFELVETGWDGGMISVIDASGHQRGCSVNRTSTYVLERGTYTIVVDGNRELARGAYTLRVDRE